MALEVLSVSHQEDVWLVTLKVYEGVYKKDEYIVRVVDVPLAPSSLDDASQIAVMKAFVLDQVTKHMRRGSLPPTGMQIEGQHVWEVKTTSSSL
ncbi:hypothetical protein [Sulfobacillus thermosulfidooxidans]|uniref:hypothetical protein n=1 Tax=Sulfobacillus thermosulfidooxidans TaxID=28034 RepID=UPI0002D9BA74|nr:hypothetical protein [Sulfobacillus thermosulfidooxidans]